MSTKNLEISDLKMAIFYANIKVKSLQRTVFIILILSLFTVFFTSIHAQEVEFIMLDSKVVESNRYVNKKDTPYFYDEWKYGKMITGNSEVVDSLQVNYNGFTDAFEVKHNDEYFELQTKSYPLILVYEEDREVYFRRNVHKKIRGSFARIVFADKHTSVIQNFRVDARKSNVYFGGINEKLSFTKTKRYFLLLNEETYKIKLNKKNLVSRLGFDDQLNAFIDQEKLDFESEKDLIRLLEYYSTLQ